ncbi:MAG: glycosyltransferase [Chitinophagales bacterium]
MKNKHVLYLSYDGMTDPLGQSQVLPYLVSLSKKGYRFSLVSFDKPDRFELNNGIIQKIVDEAGIKWYPQVYHKSPPILSTLYDIRKLKKVCEIIYKKDPYSIVHCRGYITPFAALEVKKKYSVKFLFDIRGFWPDEKVEGKDWNIKNPAYRAVYNYFKKKEVEFYNAADHSICLTYKGRDILHKRDSIANQPVPIEVIPCCVDLDLFNPDNINFEEQQKLRSELGISEQDFIISYLGSIGTWYMLDEMLEFFSLLKAKKTNAKFLFITGDNADNIKKVASKYNISHNDIIITRAPRNTVPLHLSLSNVSIFFIAPVYSKQASSPTKQGEIMGMGIPLICNDGIGDTSKVVRDYNGGAVLEAFNQASYLKIINKIDRICNLDKYEIRKGAKEFYALEIGVSRYKMIYEKLVG